ncbi:MAG: YncE family protein [Myxococcota bacterium]
MRLSRYIIIILTVLMTFYGCGGSDRRRLTLESFAFPVDLAYDEANKNLYVISSNFDLGYEYGNIKGISINLLKPLLIDPCKNECKDYNKSLILNEGINIGDYAGLSTFYNGKIFVTLRKDSKIAVIETDSRGVLSCGEGEKLIADCDEGHLISSDKKEPFSIVMREGDRCIYTSFLKSGEVICIDADNYDKSTVPVADFSNGYEIGGIKDIDISEDGILISAYAYMMGGRNPLPLSYSFRDKRYTVFLDFTDVIGSAFQESVKFSRRDKRFFLTLRNPDLLLSVDYNIYKDGTFVIEDYRLISLHRYPSRLYIASPVSSERELLFIAMEDEDKIFVYDSESQILVTEIREGLDGPYAMKLIEIDGEDYLFVANFESSTISVYKFISIENRFEYLLSIGKPRPKEKGEY